MADGTPKTGPGFPLALPAVSGDVFELTAKMICDGCEAARLSPRKRIIFPLHRRQEALVQRMLNFLQPGTWMMPHRHPLPDAIETMQVMRGALGFLIFDGDGRLVSKHRLAADSGLALMDIEPGVWHAGVALAPDTVILEIKRGPYDARTDKEFAAWAPPEGDRAADTMCREWEALFA